MKTFQPHFKKHKKNKFFSLWKIISLGLFLCCVIGAGSFFFFWPGFWIKNIEIKISEKSEIEQEVVLEYVRKILSEKFFNLVPKNNVFLVLGSDLERNILNQFPQLYQIKIDKKYFSGSKKEDILSIFAEERQSIGIWCRASEKILSSQENLILNTQEATTSAMLAQKETETGPCFHIDKQGVIFREAPLIEGGLILLVLGFDNKEGLLRSQVITFETIENIFLIRDNLENYFKNSSVAKNLKIENFGIYPAGELKVKLNEPWRIYFDEKKDLKKQLETFEKALDKQIKDTKQISEYIDLRVENRVYYK